MTVLAKIKETFVEYTTLAVLGLIALLLLILWQAVPTSFWTSISEAVPTNVLWALLGLLVVMLILETIFTVRLYLNSSPKLMHFSGVLWDREYELYCPKDETPLFQSGRSGKVVGQGVEVYQCPKCEREYSFRNANGSLIHFKDAKTAFVEKLQKLPGKNFKQVTQPTIDDFFNDDTLKVLGKFATATKRNINIEDLAKVLDLKPAVIGHHLDILTHKNFLKKTTYSSASYHPTFELTELGRAYISRKMI